MPFKFFLQKVLNLVREEQEKTTALEIKALKWYQEFMVRNIFDVLGGVDISEITKDYIWGAIGICLQAQKRLYQELKHDKTAQSIFNNAHRCYETIRHVYREIVNLIHSYH